MTPGEIRFIQQSDFVFEKELGSGATGKTILLKEPLLDESFVCKKFSPLDGSDKKALFQSFKREIKLLLRLNHINIVKIYNYFLYPKSETGFILMEFIDGVPIDQYVADNPEKTEDVFRQVISGFSHMEFKSILHRDLRMSNILVDKEGVVKIIDLGFGKQVNIPKDTNKSITLSWWCQPPSEFALGEYSTRTEIYFVGMLFTDIIKGAGIDDFKYSDILEEMCHWSCDLRTQSFHDIHKLVYSDTTMPITEFSQEEQHVYRLFADALSGQIAKIELGCKYNHDYERLITSLRAAYKSVMLEEFVLDPTIIIRCFLVGAYFYNKTSMPTAPIAPFLELLQGSHPKKVEIVISNLYQRLDSIQRYSAHKSDDDIPF